MSFRLTFALNDIIESVLVGSLTFGQSKNQFFVVFWENKFFESMLVPLDVLNVANEESHFHLVNGLFIVEELEIVYSHHFFSFRA